MDLNISDSEILSGLNELASQMFGNSGRQQYDKEVKTCIEDDTIVKQSFTTDKNNWEPVFNNLRHNQKSNVYRITPDRVTIPKASRFFTKHKKKLFESKFGASYAYRESFKAIIEAGLEALNKDASDIYNITIENNIIKFHSFEIDPSNFLDPILGNTLYDLLDFNILFKRFNNLKNLKLDSNATEILTIAYGSEPNLFYNKIFNSKAKNLQVLDLNNTVFKRNMVNATELGDLLGYSKLHSELEFVSDSKNKKLDREPTAKKNRLSIRKKLMQVNGWGAVKEKFNDNRDKIAVATGTLTALSLITGNFLWFWPLMMVTSKIRKKIK